MSDEASPADEEEKIDLAFVENHGQKAGAVEAMTTSEANVDEGNKGRH